MEQYRYRKPDSASLVSDIQPGREESGNRAIPIVLIPEGIRLKSGIECRFLPIAVLKTEKQIRPIIN